MLISGNWKQSHPTLSQTICTDPEQIKVRKTDLISQLWKRKNRDSPLLTYVATLFLLNLGGKPLIRKLPLVQPLPPVSRCSCQGAFTTTTPTPPRGDLAIWRHFGVFTTGRVWWAPHGGRPGMSPNILQCKKTTPNLNKELSSPKCH